MPSTEIPQELLRITQKQEMETGSFLTILVLAKVLSVIAIATVVVIYKKLKLAGDHFLPKDQENHDLELGIVLFGKS
jgi:hypothetical protein